MGFFDHLVEILTISVSVITMSPKVSNFRPRVGVAVFVRKVMR